MKALHRNILDRLDQIINDTGKHGSVNVFAVAFKPLV